MNRLTIAIPTYGRGEAVAENLAFMAAEAERLGVSLLYSDDSKDESVETVVLPFCRKYSNITYIRNRPALGHDLNIKQALSLPESEYVWLLSDVLRPKIGSLEKIMRRLNGQDFIFLNRKPDGGPDLLELTGAASTDFISEKLWNQTLTGVTIYNKNVLKWLHYNPPTMHRNIPQLSIILGFASCHSASVAWVSDQITESAPKKGSYWESQALDVFVTDWANTVTSYPKVIPRSRIRAVLRSHSENTYLFDTEFLIRLRASGGYRWSSLRRPHFWDVMHLGALRLIAILIIPVSISSRLVALRRRSGKSAPNSDTGK